MAFSFNNTWLILCRNRTSREAVELLLFEGSRNTGATGFSFLQGNMIVTTDQHFAHVGHFSFPTELMFASKFKIICTVDCLKAGYDIYKAAYR